MSECLFPYCKQFAQPNGYCIGHRQFSSSVSVKPAKKIPVRSENQKAVIAELKKLYKIFLAKPGNQKCKVKMEGCTGKAETIHHTRSRIGEQVFEQKDWLSCCVWCNGRLEEKDAEARVKGVKKSKFNNH